MDCFHYPLDTETLLRVPALVRRLEEQFPPRGGAPEPPPLPHIELMWERGGRRRTDSPAPWLGYALAVAVGGALVWGAAALGWW